MNGNTARVTAGHKPPEIIEHDGRRYRPVWREITTDSDIRRGEQVFIIVAMGQPLDENEDEETEE
jgi:hypothetical protein